MRIAQFCAAVLAALATATGSAAANTVHRPDLLREFRDAGTTGTMVVRQTGRIDRTVVVGDRRSRLGILPSSTFKIPNALIAIDAGIASGPDQAYPGPNPNYLVDGSPLLPTVCEGDLTLQTAFTNSCIPVFQEIARAVGAPGYRWAVRALRYGNRRTGGAAVDDFWLHGPFAITARQQVRFLERLRTGALPVSDRAVRGVRQMLVTGQEDGVTTRGKTGYVFAQDGAPRRGWYVGSVERRGQVSTFALNLDMPRDEQIAARTSIAQEILAELGAYPR